jgi:ABC-type transporter Mla MlaB component
MFDRIDTAINHPISNAVYFFRGSQYLKYVPGEGVQPLGGSRIRRLGIDGWQTLPDLFRSDLDAAFGHPNGDLYFFKGGSYVKYKPSEGVVPTDSGVLIRTIGDTGWKSFPQGFRSDIDAAVFVPELGHAYFFKRDEYIKVKFDETGKDSIVESNGSKIRKLGVQGWRELPNPFAQCLDAALYYPSDEFLYFFHDREYVRWNPDHGISARYPRRLGQLHREHEGWPGLSSLLGGPFLGSVTASTASIWIWVLGGRSTSDLLVRLNGSQEASPEFIAPPVGSSASDVLEGVEEVDSGGLVRLLQLTRLAENTSYSVEFRRADDNSLIETICFKTPPAASSPGSIRIGMGTCSNSTTEVAVDTFEAMANSSLDILILGGDNCYYYNGKKTSTSPDSDPPHDWASVGRMIRRQLECRNHPQFVTVARSVPTFSTWDDHDFSFNNCDGFRDRDDSRWVGRDRAAGVYRLMWNHPFRGDGNHIYYDFRWGPLHIFMTDGRYHSNRPDGILGPDQTNWLLNGIRTSDAPIRMAVFSSQFVAETDGECFFANATQERKQILDAVINDVKSPVLFLSGDIHRSELQRYPINSNTPRILEITSSPLKVDELDTPLRANSNRLWQTVQNSFALINVDYQGGTCSDVTGSITLEAIGANGAVLNNNGTNTPCRTVWNLCTLQLS